MSKEKVKFKFTTQWQLDLIKYIVLDRNGYRVIPKIQDSYFTLIEHQVLALCILRFYERTMRIPGETMLMEEVVKVLNKKDYIKLVSQQDKEEILKIIPKLYQGSVRDGDEIYRMSKQFSAYIRLKDLLEEIDPRNWEEYVKYSHKFQMVIEDEDEQQERSSSFLLRDVTERQLRRRENKNIIPTPYRQINALTSAGGYETGSIIVILDKQKRGKTMVLVNVAKGYLRQGKKVLYLDYENGKNSILTRFEQSINQLDKNEILKGQMDKKIKAKFRKYIRIGGEVVVERLPAGSTSKDIQSIIDKYYREHNISFDVIISDYIAKMGSTTGTKDETTRISDAYVDMSNLALRNNIEHVWTAHHVTREGAKHRMKTKYDSEDIAKCIDISRHVHAIYGINRSPAEEEAGFMRMEIVEQRDGKPFGRAVFTVNHETQHLSELNKADRQRYDDEFAKHIDEDEPREKPQRASSDFK